MHPALLLMLALALSCAGCAAGPTAEEFCAAPPASSLRAEWRRVCDAVGVPKPAPTADPDFCTRAASRDLYPFWWSVICETAQPRR